MRIYEFCKLHGLVNKEVVQLLQDHGFAVASHMSLLTAPMQELIEQRLLAKTVPAEKKMQEQAAVMQQVQPSPRTIEQENHPVQHQIQKKSPVIQPVASAALQQKPSERAVRQPQQVTAKVAAPVIKQPLVLRPMLLGEFAEYIGKPSSEVILTLLRQKIVCNKNQILSEKIIKELAQIYEVAVVAPTVQQATAATAAAVTQQDLAPRPPIVVVIGHVDHGKTTLLDYIRKTRVAAREKGGITQHLGAYEVATANGKVIFLDTPGHEAFSLIRVRGVSVADIAILVVAADDGVMPQTVEAIKQAQLAKIAMIVAINKVDKVDEAAVDRVKMQLAQHDVLVDSWGGQIVAVPISAKLGTNVDQLLEMIVLQAELMELRSRQSGAGEGVILESKLEKGRGVVATLILRNGIAAVGDYFTAGAAVGRINAVVNSAGARLEKIGPAIPVAIAGFESMPQAGDSFAVVSQEQYKQAKNAEHVAPSLAQQLQSVHEDAINVVIKADANSSKEAIVNALAKISDKEAKKVAIIYAGVGNISQSDIDLAQIAGAVVYGFGVKIEPGVATEAARVGVGIQQYDIIYELLDSIKAAIVRSTQPAMVTVKTGTAVVRKVFDIKNVGVIAGCYVSDGKIIKGGSATIWRGKYKIGQGQIESLQRDKRAMKEVATGFECAFIVQGHNDFAVDDRIECFVTQAAQTP